jgi:hypothetical protein
MDKEIISEKKQEYINKALQVIKDHKIYYIEEIALMMGISKETFYFHRLNESDDIKDAILEAKIKVKSKLRNKWEDSDNPALQIALYKIIGNEDELQRLNNNQNNNQNNQPIAPPQVTIVFNEKED